MFNLHVGDEVGVVSSSGINYDSYSAKVVSIDDHTGDITVDSGLVFDSYGLRRGYNQGYGHYLMPIDKFKNSMEQNQRQNAARIAARELGDLLASCWNADGTIRILVDETVRTRMIKLVNRL